MAVEDAVVGQQDFQQRDAAAIGRISVADAHAFGRADAFAALAGPLGGARRGARGIILGGVCKDSEAVEKWELRHSFLICSNHSTGQR